MLLQCFQKNKIMFAQRIKTIQKQLEKKKIDALLVSSVANIYYLSGLSSFSQIEREAYVLITKTSAFLFTDPRYITAAESNSPDEVNVLLHTELVKILKSKKFKTIGIEENLTIKEFHSLKNKTGKKLHLTKGLIENIRVIKDSEELKNIKLACSLTDKTFTHIKSLIKIGVSEKQIAWEMEKFIKDTGGELAFDTIVAFGENSAVPHHKTSEKKLDLKDEFILLDFGAKVNGYCSDMTRTLLTKNSSKKAKTIYQTVFKAQDAAIETFSNFKTSINASIPGKAANEYITHTGFDEIPHGLGHGIGIEVHERPHVWYESEDILKKGMVFSIEPGIYIPEFGGVRIEDDFLLSEKGLVQLTNSSKEPIEI